MKKKLILAILTAVSLVAVTQIPALFKQQATISHSILQPEDDSFFTFIYYYVEPIMTNMNYLILLVSIVLNIAFYRQLKRTAVSH